MRVGKITTKEKKMSDAEMCKAEYDGQLKAKQAMVAELANIKDPWIHRSSGMKCQTCMWFAAKAPRQDFGRCRRHAPSMNGYPAVFGNDWCGDHKLDETKIGR